MTEDARDDVIETSRRAFAALARDDLDAFLELVDPEVEFNSLLAEVDRRTFHGHEGVREWYSLIRASLGGVRFENAEIQTVDLPGTAIVRIVVTGEVAGVEVNQVMWQVVHAPEGKALWWGIHRTREEAIEAAEAQIGS